MGILVAGTGALACLFAARLAAQGNEVTMLGNWPEGLAALRNNHLRLLEMDGSTHQYSVEVLDGSSCEGDYAHALVLVKSWQTERTGKQLKRCLSVNGMALTLQNGLGNVETLKKALGQQRVAIGVTTVGARMLEPGYVQHTGDGKVTLAVSPGLQSLTEQLGRAGFQVETTTDLASLQWGKLVINAAINPLTALLRVANGELLSRPGARDLMKEAAQEAASVAASLGIGLPYSDPVGAVEEVAHKTASNISSMLQDVLRGTPTEIEAINGAVVRAGENRGVPTPLNYLLWRLVKALDQRE
jgi:2-dehydropantoate 2-reductase